MVPHSFLFVNLPLFDFLGALSLSPPKKVAGSNDRLKKEIISIYHSILVSLYSAEQNLCPSLLTTFETKASPPTWFTPLVLTLWPSFLRGCHQHKNHPLMDQKGSSISLSISRAHTYSCWRASPFAPSITWWNTHTYIYIFFLFKFFVPLSSSQISVFPLKRE